MATVKSHKLVLHADFQLSLSNFSLKMNIGIDKCSIAGEYYFVDG
jgi:hypothetical protein